MQKSGGAISVIAGIFGVIAAIVTLVFGGLGSAVGTSNAGTVVGLGWGGVLFSFLAIVFGAVAFAKPKGAGIALVITSILGAVLGGTFVAIFMVLSLIGGILVLVGAKRAPAAAAGGQERTVGQGAATKSRTGLWIGLGVGVLVLLVIAVVAGSGMPSKSDRNSDLAAAEPSKLVPTGELADLFTFGSRYTDLQRENKQKEITGQIVQWRLTVNEIAKRGQNYRVQTAARGMVGTFLELQPKNDDERKAIENLKTGDSITIRGKISGVTMRHLEIKPAILAQNSAAPAPQAPVIATSVLPDGSTITMSAPVPLSPPAETAKNQPGVCANAEEVMQCLDKEFTSADKLLNDTYKQVTGRMDAAQKASLKTEQLAWIKEKEAKCEKAGAENAGGQLERIQIAECMVTMTKARSSYLAGLR